MDIGKIVSVVISEPVVVGDTAYVDVSYALEMPLEYITIEFDHEYEPVVEPVPA